MVVLTACLASVCVRVPAHQDVLRQKNLAVGRRSGVSFLLGVTGFHFIVAVGWIVIGASLRSRQKLDLQPLSQRDGRSGKDDTGKWQEDGYRIAIQHVLDTDVMTRGLIALRNTVCCRQCHSYFHFNS